MEQYSEAQLKLWDLWTPRKNVKKPDPRIEQKEVRVYKIWWKDEPDIIYVGCTEQTLAQRMRGHRSAARAEKVNTRIYQHMREKGITTFKYTLLEYARVQCELKGQLEQKWIDKLQPSLNTNYKVYVTKDEVKQYSADYYIKYRKRMKGKTFRCVCCDQTYSLLGKNKHLKTQKHYKNYEEYMKGLYSVVED